MAAQACHSCFTPWPRFPPTRSFPNPAKADTVHRRQAICAQQAWAEGWCNGSVPQDDAACEAHILVGRTGRAALTVQGSAAKMPSGMGHVALGWAGRVNVQ